MAVKGQKQIMQNIENVAKLSGEMKLDATAKDNDITKSIEADVKDFTKLATTIDDDKNNTMSSMSKNIQTLTDAMKNRDGKFSNTEVDTALMSQLNLIYTNPESLSVFNNAYQEGLLRNRVYEDYDLLMKFLPITKSILRDNVVPALISPNDHTKSFLNIEKVGNYIDDKDEADWKEKYKAMEIDLALPIKIKELVEYVCYYGRQYVRVVPYSKLMTRLLRNLDNIDNRIGTFYNGEFSGSSSIPIAPGMGLGEAFSKFEEKNQESIYEALIEANGNTKAKVFNNNDLLNESTTGNGIIYDFTQDNVFSIKDANNTYVNKLKISGGHNNNADIDKLMNFSIMERLNNNVEILNSDYNSLLENLCATLSTDNFKVLNEMINESGNDTKLRNLKALLEREFFSKDEEYIMGSARPTGDLTTVKQKSAEAFLAMNEVKPTDRDYVKLNKKIYYERLCIRKTRPIKINDIVMGYYVFENLGCCSNRFGSNLGQTVYGTGQNTGLTNPYNSLTMRDVERYIDNNNDSYNDAYTMRFAQLLIKKINKKFLEKNQDFVESVYEILKYYDIHNNDVNLRVRFIPADEVVEVRINDGISLLDDALFPGKLYVTLLLSNFMLKLIRSQDKRVYYIKQGIDTNVTNTLMNAIRSIKSGEMSLSDFGNMNRLMNSIGRFTDLFIPVSPNGDKPFDFEIMSGQDVNLQDDFMEELKKATILALGTPYGVTEYDERTDLATRLVSENIKFAYQIIFKQMELGPYLSRLLSKIIQAYYPEHTEDVTVVLPAPINLKINIMSEQLNNLGGVADAIVEQTVTNSDDPLAEAYKVKLKSKVIRDLAGGVLDFGKYDKLLEEVKIDVKKQAHDNKVKEDIENS